MLNREEVLKLNNEFINESFNKLGNDYRGQVIIDIPKTLISSIRNSSKKELDFDSTENYSDVAICDLIIEYIKNTYLNKESIPVGELFGINSVGNEVETEVDNFDDVEPQATPQPTMDEVETEFDETDFND